jgi:xylan 1,4-beta-xylosidase
MIYLRQLFFCLFFTLAWIHLSAQNPSFASYMNPVIPGDHPDPTMTKIGNDFYTTGSSFAMTPVIYHSTDLIHWEAIAQPVSANWSQYGAGIGDGCWGGNLVFYGNKYWDFFGHWGTMYFVTASTPKGPWSAPVKMNCPASVPGLGMDNSIFIDDDGSWYMMVKNGQENNWILQLGTDGQPKGKILDLRWINPAPDYIYSWAEGPVMWKFKGYYYYSFAMNAYAGQKVFRNKNLVADKATWEIFGDFYNESDPKKPQTLFAGPNHTSQVVMLDDSTSWAVVHSNMRTTSNNTEWQGAGRQGLITQVKYNSAGRPIGNFPINEPMTAPRLPSGGIPWMVPHSDFFNATKLNPEWSQLGYSPYLAYSLTARPGWVRLYPNNAQNTLLKNDAEHNYSLITRLESDAKTTTSEAGLKIITGGQIIAARLFSSANSLGEKVIRFSFDKVLYETPNISGKVVWLKLVRVNHVLTGYFSVDGFEWKQVGSAVDASLIDRQDVSSNGWTGTHQGIYVKGTAADFDLYIYREAFTPILAECPANQFGTVKGSAFLDQIHNNDWALYAGVEFGDNDYPVHLLAFEATTSSVSASGMIEVWLDSLQTGKKIADCPITSTGSYTTYKTFSIDISEVTGNHDVYLKFTGEGTGTLFQLKSFRFIGGLKQVTANQNKLPESGQLSVFPNPATNQFTVSGKEPFSRLRILNLNGQVVYEHVFGQPTLITTCPVHQPAGTYVLEVSNKKGIICTRLIVF